MHLVVFCCGRQSSSGGAAAGTAGSYSSQGTDATSPAHSTSTSSPHQHYHQQQQQQQHHVTASTRGSSSMNRREPASHAVDTTPAHQVSVMYPYSRWLGSRAVSVVDPGAEGPGFKSQPRRCRVTVLGKLFTPIVPLFTASRLRFEPGPFCTQTTRLLSHHPLTDCCCIVFDVCDGNWSSYYGYRATLL